MTHQKLGMSNSTRQYPASESKTGNYFCCCFKKCFGDNQNEHELRSNYTRANSRDKNIEMRKKNSIHNSEFMGPIAGRLPDKSQFERSQVTADLKNEIGPKTKAQDTQPAAESIHITSTPPNADKETTVRPVQAELMVLSAGTQQRPWHNLKTSRPPARLGLRLPPLPSAGPANTWIVPVFHSAKGK